MLTRSTMTEAQRSGVEAWLVEAAKVLRLTDWDIMVDDGPTTDVDTWAETEPVHSYPAAVIRVNPLLLDQPDEEILRSLVHELVHLYHADMIEALQDSLHGLDEERAEIIERTVRRYLERLVDSVARLVSRTVPLPSLDEIRPPGREDR